MVCRWESSLNPFPRLFVFFFWLFNCFFSSGFLPVLRTMCRWKSSLYPFPILFDFFLIIFCFFLRVLPVLRTICKWKPSLHPFPILFVFFPDYLLFFFLEFLPVLRTICRWKPSLPPFPILLDFFLIIFLYSGFFCQFWEQSANESLPYILSPYYFDYLVCFFLSFCQFWEQSADENLPCLLSPYYWLFFAFFSGFCQFWEQSPNENLPYILSPYYLIFFSDYFLFFFPLGFYQFWALPASFPHTIWSFSDYFLSLDFVFMIFAFLVCFFVDFLFWIKSLFFGVCGVCGFTTLVYLIPRSESDTASVWEQLRKILAALWSEECLCWFMG